MKDCKPLLKELPQKIQDVSAKFYVENKIKCIGLAAGLFLEV